MGKLKNKAIEILEIADSLSDDFDIRNYADFTMDDVEYIALETQVDCEFVCEVLNINVDKLEGYEDLEAGVNNILDHLDVMPADQLLKLMNRISFELMDRDLESRLRTEVDYADAPF